MGRLLHLYDFNPNVYRLRLEQTLSRQGANGVADNHWYADSSGRFRRCEFQHWMLRLLAIDS